MNTIRKLPNVNKVALLTGARVAMEKPGEREFWREVQDRMDIRDARETNKVAPRPKK